MERIAFVVMANRHSGKSRTWYDLFGRKVSKGRKKLMFNKKEFATVYVLSASSEEKRVSLSSRLGSQRPKILLLSIQYIQSGYESFNFLIEEGYDIRCIWLNPGFNDVSKKPEFDHLGLVPYLLFRGVTLAIQSGKGRTKERVAAIRETIYGWASFRKLIEYKKQ